MGNDQAKRRSPLVCPRCGPLTDRYYPSPLMDDLRESIGHEGPAEVSLGAPAVGEPAGGELPAGTLPVRLDRKLYEKELCRLQVELVKMQYWAKATGFRLIVLFEGRDAAGKGGTIKRITEPLNPRGCRVVALGTPSDQQKTQWYFQRYVEHFPSAGEIVIFDRSWYNRAGVERVMGFCSKTQVEEFLQSSPEFERMLVRSGIVLLKYWFSVSDDEQEARFRARIDDPTRRWKLSPMDLEARKRWVEFSRAKDEMFAHTNIPEAPWFTVEADDKRRARLNCISHLLSKVPYTDMTPPAIKLPPRPKADSVDRPPRWEQFFVPNRYP
ncbi:MAG: polyphosphate kinase 2 [Cyanobacteriota bacterium]|nr:polyphosphate kinase 2 [Cyanobacteriota bacterium]